METYVQDLNFYVLAKIFLLAVFILCGAGISYKNTDNKYFWYYAIPAIIIYALIEGLRYDRGVDYEQYATELQGLHNDDFGREFIYDGFVTFVRAFRIPYWTGFIFLSGLLITSVMCVVRNFPKIAIWALPLFLLVTDYAAENLVRQFAAIPFLLFAYAAYCSNRKTLMAILLACMPFIHITALFPIALFIVFIFFNPGKLLRTPWIPVALYLLTVTIGEVTDFTAITGAIEDVGFLGDSKMTTYTEDADRWFTDDGSISYVNATQGGVTIVTYLADLMFCGLLIYLGFNMTRENQKFVIPYWFAFFSIIITTMFGDIELYARMAWWLRIFIPVITGLILARSQLNIYLKLLFFAAIFLKYLYPFILLLPFPFSGGAFVWDIV